MRDSIILKPLTSVMAHSHNGHTHEGPTRLLIIVKGRTDLEKGGQRDFCVSYSNVARGGRAEVSVPKCT